jgi:hypothetical protein
LYKHAKKQAEEGSSLLASTHHLPNRSGDAAFDTIISDTEETYGIAIPSDVVEALKRAAVGSILDASFLSIVKSLHDDGVIHQAGIYRGEAIPVDLVSAIRSTSLPPGVSVETLMPIDDGGSLSVSASIASANRSKKSSKNSLSFCEESVDEEAYLTDTSVGSEITGTSQPDTAEGLETHHGSFAVSQDALEKSYEDLAVFVDAVEPNNSDENEMGKVPRPSGSATRTNNNGTPALDISQHSDTSWSGLSLSKSPAVTGKKPGKATKKHKKGSKDEMLGRARKRREKAKEFMNSLADFGNQTDDLREVYTHAKDTLESYTPLDAERKQSKSDSDKAPAPAEDKASGSSTPLEPVDKSSTSFVSIMSVLEEESETILEEESEMVPFVPRPDVLDSCIEVSPQEFELDMLFDAAEEKMGEPIEFNVDIALRKASRSMDESLDFMAPMKTQAGQAAFGLHVPLERLEIIYQEAEIFLGSEIPSGTIAALRQASDELLKASGDRKTKAIAASSALDPASGARENAKNPDKDKISHSQSRPQREYNQKGKPRHKLKYMEDQGNSMSSLDEVPVPTSQQRRAVSAPLPSKTSHSIDTLFSVAHGGEDDLGALYKAAYAESPRVNNSSTIPAQNFPISPPDFSFPNPKGSQSKVSSTQAKQQVVCPASPPRNDLGAMYKAAYAESPRVNNFSTPPAQNTPISPPDFSSPNPKGSQSNVSSTQAKQQVVRPASPPRDISPPVPSFATPLKKKSQPLHTSNSLPTSSKEGLTTPSSPPRDLSPLVPSFGTPKTSVPVSEVSAPVAQDGMELSNSGRPFPELSPMSECSLGTDGDVGSFKEGYISLMTASKARLNVLSQTIPDLDVDNGEEAESEMRAITSESNTEKSRSIMSIAAIADTSDELDAIISQTQQEYGMELPRELVEALLKTSVHSLTTDLDGSFASSLIMQNIDLDEEDLRNEDSVVRDLIMEVGKRISLSGIHANRSKLRKDSIENSGHFSALSENEEISVLVDDFADYENNMEDIIQEVDNVNGTVPDELLEKLRSGVDAKKGSSKQEYSGDFEYSDSTFSSLANSSHSGVPFGYRRPSQYSTNEDSLSRIEETERQIDVHGTVPGELLEKLQLGGSFASSLIMQNIDLDEEDLRNEDSVVRDLIIEVGKKISLSEIHANRSKLRKDSIEYGGHDASGYFSALSENEDISVLLDDFADYDNNMEDIIQEVENAYGAIPGELLEKLRSGVDAKKGSSKQEYSGDLEYSESTFSSLANSSHSGVPFGCRRPSQYSTNEDSLSRIEETERQIDIDFFVTEATKEYGKPLPSDLVAALKSMSMTSKVLFDENFDAKAAIRKSEELNRLSVPEDVVEALNKAARKTSLSLAQTQHSMISALSNSDASLEDTYNSSSEWGNEDDVELADVFDETEKASSGFPPIPPPPPPAPGTPSTSSSKPPINRNLGPSLMKEVKKIYRTTIPLELLYVLTRSTVLPSAMNTDEEIHIIMGECEDMSGKRLPADLVLALREASVTLRTPSNSTRSRRSRLIRQSSGSFRSNSRSSGMPSIQEWTVSTGSEDIEVLTEGKVAVDRLPASFSSAAIPGEITTEAQLGKEAPPETPSDGRLGAVSSSFVDEKANGRSLGTDIPSRVSQSTAVSGSAASWAGSEEKSIGIEALMRSPVGGPRKLPSQMTPAAASNGLGGSYDQTTASPQSSPNRNSHRFNNSTTTEVVSNRQDKRTWEPLLTDDAPVDLEVDADEELTQSLSMDSTLHTLSTRSRPPVRRNSSSSSTSTEVTTNTVSSNNRSTVSIASTLPSRKLPIGVNPTPPLDGVDSDDLSLIFKEAAKRF